MRTTSLLLLASLLGACGHHDETTVPVADLDRAPPPDAARAGLERAHHAYAAGQPRLMTQELLTVLRDPSTDEVARANAIALADRAFNEGQGSLDTGFLRPAGMGWMRLTVLRSDSDGSRSHMVLLNGGLERGVEVRDVSLTRLRDGHVLASRASKVGYFETGVEGSDRYFYIQSSPSVAALESGAYRLGWSYTDGRSGESDVLVPGVSLDEGPTILEPAQGVTVESRQPRLRWTLPGWVSGPAVGQRVLDARVNALDGNGGVDVRWSMWETGASRTEVTLGEIGKPVGATLAPGQTHRLSVQIHRRLQYGELQLGGAIQTSRSFTVAAEH